MDLMAFFASHLQVTFKTNIFCKKNSFFLIMEYIEFQIKINKNVTISFEFSSLFDIILVSHIIIILIN